MALFRKKKNSTETTEVEKELVPGQNEVTEENEETVETTLIFHPDLFMTPQEKYVYRYHHLRLPKLKENQISISGLKLHEHEGNLFVIAFLRNTLPKSVHFESVDLIILNKEKQPIAKQTFDMDDLIDLAPKSCMPWTFLFTEDSRLTEEVPGEGDWTIAFELKSKDRPHQLDLEASWENQLAPNQREHLEKLVAGLPKLSQGEVNFMGIEAKFVQDHAFAVTVLIRNGSTKNIQLEQIPLIVEDADGDIVCQGGFKLDQFEVKANTSKPWTFIFPAQLVLKPEPNLASWKVYPPAQQKAE
ncbi:accessory Sec system S-layer assembly protein [Bacillus massilinigeriensis]|uniref:accessory Sec system S-layer assembly protein n=1 Tax=Bacillus massilionigeriensis TaxID=1805475 RepID=UPI00096B4B1F|nr:accessory Sec system S-layer assembly protein [Bacillus massilionigeriensis]